MQLTMPGVKFQAWGFRLQTRKDASQAKAEDLKFQKKSKTKEALYYHRVYIGIMEKKMETTMS